jgi:hypothetical protein
MSLSVIAVGLEAFTAANVSAAESISAAGTADSAAMLGTVGAALGSIGVSCLGAC